MNMKWFHLLILALALLFLPGTTSALEAWAECGQTNQVAAAALTPTANKVITTGESRCYYFTGTEDSDPFVVVASTALIFFRPDAEGDGGGNAAIMISRCLPGTTTYSANVCVDILDTALDGTAGASTTQKTALRVARGTYAIINSVTAAADEAIVSIEGE